MEPLQVPPPLPPAVPPKKKRSRWWTFVALLVFIEVFTFMGSSGTHDPDAKGPYAADYLLGRLTAPVILALAIFGVIEGIRYLSRKKQDPGGK